MKKIVAFSGSNSTTSINQTLVRYAAKLSTHKVEVISIIDYPAPVFGVDLLREEGIPAAMQALFSKMQEADGFIVSTPEHNGSMPAVLKNTIDWLSKIEGKVFLSKPTLFLSTSPGSRGAQTALEHLVNIMSHRGAQITGSMSLPSFHENFVEDKLSQPFHATLLERVQELDAALINS